MSNSWSAVPYRTRQHIKQVLLARGGLVCCVCGTRIKTIKAATIEHKRERNAGGSLLDYANLGLAHPRCNYSRRGSRVGRVGLVAGVGFFAPASTEHPAPPVFPSPGRSEKNGGDQE